MASTSNLKPIAKLALRLAALTQFALFAVAACSSTPPTQAAPCGNVPSCPSNQVCYMNACTPFPTGSGGNTSVGSAGNSSAGNSPVGSAGNTTVGSAGGAGVPGTIGAGGAGGNAPGAGGSSPTAGTGPIGTAGSAGTGPVTSGAGYWTFKDWHGCSWTGVGTEGTSTVTPKDFTTKAAADPYCISGSVGKVSTSGSVALLGFNVNEPSSASCVAKPADTTGMGPPSAMATADGIAVNFVKKGTDTSFTFRVQIQGPNGAMAGTVGAADRWCATISEVSGKVFVPWASFTPSCWAASGSQGTPYAKQPISAVVFTVPGNAATDVPYNVCVNGVAYGSSKDDAPDGTATQGDLMGTIGGATGMAKDFERVKVNAGGHDYIIQNNNWGNPDGSDQTLTYKNNSFKVTANNGSGASAPASFPSIYIGNNGSTGGNVFSTKSNDGLPALVSSIKSITSTFRYSPASIGDSINATYDIWFAKAVPTATYNDAIDGFVMIWLHAPTDKHPIGYEKNKAGTETINNQTWDVYVGPRGGSGTNSGAPVISFVNPTSDNSRAQTFVNVDIKKFIDVATMKYTLPANAYLTDVFGGFEIWNGSASTGLSVDEFTCVVNK